MTIHYCPKDPTAWVPIFHMTLIELLVSKMYLMISKPIPIITMSILHTAKVAFTSSKLVPPNRFISEASMPFLTSLTMVALRPSSKQFLIKNYLKKQSKLL